MRFRNLTPQQAENYHAAFVEGRGNSLRCSHCGPLFWERYRTRKKGLNHYHCCSISCVYQSTAKLFVAGDVFMNTGTCKGLDARSWKDLYQAALCESDLNKLPERIADAETALVMRARDLFYTSADRFEEEESLDDALCILHALRSSLKRRPTAVPATNRDSQSMLSAG